MANPDTTQFILQALNAIKKSCEERTDIKPGIIENISGIIFLLQKIRKYYEPKTIGFFGAQKRGKSSLINELLGCDLMPTSPIPMSSAAIEIKQDSSISDGKYKIDIFHSSGVKDMSQTVDYERARMMLREYGSHKGVLSDSVDTIRVCSSFPNSKILENGGVLVDTPGAEIAFEQGEKADVVNNADAARAITILSRTHIVVFVERADAMESKNSQQFFDAHLRSMRPLGVLNWKDVFGNGDAKYEKISSPDLREQAKMCDMQRIMLKTYGFNMERLLCVSSKEASDARKDNNPDLMKRSGIPFLEKRILSELEKLNPRIGLVTCFEELATVLRLIEDNVNESISGDSNISLPLHDRDDRNDRDEDENRYNRYKDKAREVFQNAQRPFYVFINNETDETLKDLANTIFMRYRSN